MSTRKTVLVTGASGVVGTALLPELAAYNVICLTHRRAPRGGGEHFQGDLRAPMLGLEPAVYRNLLTRVDAVVHCAAETGFSTAAEDTEALNVAGTRQIVRFAADAGATLYYVSTAFVDRADRVRRATGEASADPVHYLRSKRAAEQVVRDGHGESVIIRPSVVIGDSRTGEMAQFQGLHAVAAAVLTGALPLAPIDPLARVDFVPQDLVARALAGLLGAGVHQGEFWVTAGTSAPAAAAVFETFTAVGRDLGLDLTATRLVPPEMVDRLIRPVFISSLPVRARRKFDDMVAMCGLFAGDEPLPSSLAELPGVAPLSPAEVLDTLATSVRHLAHAKGLVRMAGVRA